MVVRGGAGFSELDDTALSDPLIAALRQRVEIGEDPAMTAAVPRLRPARVTVRLTDGRQATHSRNSHRGDFNEPFAETEIRGKFRQLAATVLARDIIGKVERAIDRCEEWANVAELPRLLRRLN
jgi:2-methylcitrate dehydratase PrpD